MRTPLGRSGSGAGGGGVNPPVGDRQERDKSHAWREMTHSPEWIPVFPIGSYPRLGVVVEPHQEMEVP
jgi:hypothetical protein